MRACRKFDMLPLKETVKKETVKDRGSKFMGKKIRAEEKERAETERPWEFLNWPSHLWQRQDVPNSQPTPGPSPAERVGPGGEEIPMIAQFSP